MWWTGKFLVTYQLQIAQAVLDRRKDMMLVHRDHMALDHRKHMVLDHRDHMALDHRKYMVLDHWEHVVLEHQEKLLLDEQEDMVLDHGKYLLDYYSLDGCFRRSRSWCPGGYFVVWSERATVFDVRIY